MDKIWLKSYPPGIPADINPDQFSSIVEIFEESCRTYTDSPAYYNMGTTLSYREMDAYSRAFAAYLQFELGLKKGDRFAIMLPNTLQYPVAVYGALRAGLTVVNVNPLYTASELTFQLRDSGAKAILVLSNFAHTVATVLEETPLKHVIVSEIGDFFAYPKACFIYFVLKYIKKKIPAWDIPHAIKLKTLLKKGKKIGLQPVTLNHNDIAFLQYTGGTTGVAKGAMLSHRNIVANILQAEAWFGLLFTRGQEAIVTALPLYHIFSLLANCLFIMRLGGKNILITNPRDIRGMVSEMRKNRFTAITGVNTLFNALVNDPDFAKLDFSRMKLSLGGGMSVQQTVADKWQAMTGVTLLEAYGLTETSPCVAINPVNLKTYNGSVGLPVSSTNICILDENHEEMPQGSIGELAVKGPQVMQGYWQNPNETKKVFTEDGWLLTGDIASVDELGFVHIVDRKKDLISVSGFKVFPNEIEDVIMHLPGVLEVAVVGVPDEHSGEAVKAYIVKKDPNLKVEEVVAFCHQHLTGYKVPKQIEFSAELPKSNVGKILRRALRVEVNHPSNVHEKM